jgi:hypothetical protein
MFVGTMLIQGLLKSIEADVQKDTGLGSFDRLARCWK